MQAAARTHSRTHCRRHLDTHLQLQRTLGMAAVPVDDVPLLVRVLAGNPVTG